MIVKVVQNAVGVGIAGKGETNSQTVVLTTTIRLCVHQLRLRTRHPATTQPLLVTRWSLLLDTMLLALR